jgi:light-regulated signal transduction histidine kinase (bacteriophytochrome)
MSALIDDLLELAQIPRAAMKLERVDLSALAASLVEDLRQRHPGRSVTVEIAPGLEAMVDPTLAGIALQNLLTNAWKFTGKREAAHIQFGRLPPPQAAYFVRDDGVGFDMAHAAELFEPFHRMHSRAEYEGTGVGLATVHRIVSRHGGRIWAESAPGAGTTFYFTLGEQP